jgi:predicted Zn-dependent protease with MMP-like domain
MFADAQRNRFDESLDRVIAELPEDLRALMEDVPLIVEDEPSRELADQLGIDRSTTDLCGLHSGVPLTQRSVQDGARLPDRMMLFRGPIERVARHRGGSLTRQVRTTLLHEIGHHFGLGEEDLERLGYA